jgi:hypothetical protein
MPGADGVDNGAPAGHVGHLNSAAALLVATVETRPP